MLKPKLKHFSSFKRMSDSSQSIIIYENESMFLLCQKPETFITSLQKYTFHIKMISVLAMECRKTQCFAL